jgi:hypothetical protein
LSYNEKREFAALETEIATLLAQQEQINLRFHAQQLGHDTIKELSLQLGTISQQLTKAEARRCALAEKM